MRTPLSSFSKVYCCKTHVFSVFAGDVPEILGSFSNPQKIGSHSYHDQRNGILFFFIFDFIKDLSLSIFSFNFSQNQNKYKK